MVDQASPMIDVLLLDAALENIPQGFCVWSSSFHLAMWNQRYLDLYGFAAQDIRRGMTLLELASYSASRSRFAETPAEFVARYQANLLANRGGERAKTQERLASGQTIERTHVYSPGLGWVVTHEDVTEEIQRAATARDRQTALERQNIRLDAAVNNISQGLCMYDAEGRLVICNQPYQRIYNLPETLLRPGTRLEDILAHLFDQGMRSGDDRESYIRWRREVIARGEYGKNIHELNGRVIVMQHHPMADGGWVSTHEDITEQRQTEARMRHLAQHDTLTDLPNRIHFLEEMALVEGAIARGEQAAVLWVDLDRFKAVNDTLGHAIGDALLKQVSARLWGTRRETDLLARLGGDEFAMLLKPLDGPRQAAAVAERIVKAIAVPFQIGAHQIVISASVGIAVAPGDGSTADALMKNADLAAYRAKTEGRSTYHFFEPGMDATLQRRRVIEAGLKTALESKQLHLVFQPLVGLAENRVTCFEALLRWEHPERGSISPSEFIPVAEDTGLIIAIGEWALREACRIASSWPENIRVAVNLSPVQFRNRGLLETVQLALGETGLAASRLELEITESLLLAENEQTLDILHRLRHLGVRIALDDFGTGYSSLSYLRSFPFDKIKIDRSFMRDLKRKGDSLAIIKAIIGLGHSLGMSLTAEGVETAEQLKAVREQGCNEVQGFLFSPAITPEAVTALLKSTGGRGLSADLGPTRRGTKVTQLRA